MRCSATIQTRAGQGFYRGKQDPDHQCKRQAVKLGMCGQHYAVAYAAHQRVLNRILAIPPRD